MMAPLPPDAPIGIYVHVPFCAHICPYCDFNTYARQESLIPAYVDAVMRDLHGEADRIGGRESASIFLGGGTPSLLSVEQVARVLHAIGERFVATPSIEVTMEANPNGLTLDYLAGLRAAGVNR